MLSEIEAKRMVEAVPHWHHAFEIFPGVVTPGSYDPGFLWDKLNLPKDLNGARVLDIGVSDGFFSLQAARAGADVVAIDYRKKEEHGFAVTEALNDLKVDYRVMNVYDLDQKNMGLFDIVIFLGVLYHLPDMIKALHIIRGCSKGSLYLETHSDNSYSPDVPAARYFRADTLAGDNTNFWSPNRLCVTDMLFDCRFDVVRDEIFGDRLFCEATASDAQLGRAEKMRMGYGRATAAGD